jgi:hypothetical protein
MEATAEVEERLVREGRADQRDPEWQAVGAEAGRHGKCCEIRGG